MSWKNVQYGKKRVRRNYSRVLTNVELPNLIDIQTGSFKWLLNEGLNQLFEEISPIKDYQEEKYELYFGDHWFEEPKYDIRESKNRGVNYERRLMVNVRLVLNETGEFIEQPVYLGDYPVMTPWGTFVYNGAERVCVTQIIRSAGVFFSKEKDKKTGHNIFGGQVIPTRGAWIEYEMGSKDIWYAKFDRSKKIPLTTFMKALGLGKNSELKTLFYGDYYDQAPDFLNNTFTKAGFDAGDEALNALYEKVKPGEPATSADKIREFICSRIYDKRRYDLAKVGRHKVNGKLDVVNRAVGSKLAKDVVDPVTKKVILPEGTEIYELPKNGEEKSTAQILREHRDAYRFAYKPSTSMNENCLIIENGPDGNRKTEIILEALDIKKTDGKYVHIVGNDQREDAIYICLSDIVASISSYINLHDGVGSIDDIDHLGNRRLRPVGELLQNQFRYGLSKLEKKIKDNMASNQNIDSFDNDRDKWFQRIINTNPLTSTIREFFGSSQLSQFMDQINPLSELTHKRRISALGQGGISRDRAGFEVRDVHPTHYGRICPVETPEGQNIGLINSIATFSTVNEYGFIKTPYLVVKQENGKTIITDEKVYFTADEEADKVIAEANVHMEYDEVGNIIIVDDKVMVHIDGEFAEVSREKIQYVDVSPKQVVAVSPACIPFLEHDDTTRALMGANMQRQAIPLLKPEAPFVGTGIEYKAAKDSGVAIVADVAGVVDYVDSQKIVVRDDNGELHTYILSKYDRSNASTCINQKPIVAVDEKIEVGDILADGPSMDQGELALGRNVVIAFMTWNGYNYEDAVIMSERMVQDDVYTSIHIEEYSVEVRETKIGKEFITNELEGEAKEKYAMLDENGIVRLGAEVEEGDTLVGKITPKGITTPTAQDQLTYAILGEQAKDVKVTSLKVPHGGGGIVGRIEHFKRSEGAQLPDEVLEVVRVYIVQKRKIQQGDKMSGRHGNKGVVSNILPIEDMPYMSDGTPVDIMLNPQGVPSRMNIGQVLEIHLGMAAKRLGIHVATPVFDGVRHDDLVEIMDEAREKTRQLAKEDPTKSYAIIDENGKTQLYDGRTGRPFDNKTSVGVMYMIKLAHMVDDKLHARSEGPYQLITQQPMGGKAQNGGQRFGEMEVWALEAYGAAYTLQEMMTIKSDDMIGRNQVYKAIVDGNELPKPGVPEAFRTLIKELQGLGIKVRLVDQDGKNVENESLVERIAEANASLKAL